MYPFLSKGINTDDAKSGLRMLQNGQDPNNEGNSINRINPHRVTGSNGQLYAMDWTEYLELSVLKRPFDQDSPFKSCVGSTAAPSGRLCYYHP